MIAAYKIFMKSKQVRPEEADLWTGKDVIDRDEQEWIEKEAAERASGKKGGSWIYRHSVGYIF
jgi:amino acid transporter